MVTTGKQSGKAYEFAGLGLGSPSETQNTAVGWADGGGSWREPLPGSISFAACAFAMKSGLTSTKHSCRWDALSSAGTF